MIKYLIIISIFGVVIGGVLYYLPVLLGRTDSVDAASGTVRGEQIVSSESLVYYSGDGGATFSAARVEYGGGSFSLESFHRASSGRFYAITNQGLVVSDDQGRSWGLISDDADTLRSGRVLSLALAQDEVGYISMRKGTAAYIFRTKDAFKTLDPIFASQENIAAISMELRGVNLYLGMSDGEIMVYNTENGTFRLYGKISAPVMTLVVKDDGTLYAVTESKGIFLYRGAEHDWTRVGEANLKAIADPLTIFDVSSDSVLPYELSLAASAGILRTGNFGKTWELLPTVAPERSQIQSIAQTLPGKIFAGKKDVLYTSGDGGVTWLIRPFVQDSRIINKIQIFEGGKLIFIGTTDEQPKSALSFGFSLFSPPKFAAPKK